MSGSNDRGGADERAALLLRRVLSEREYEQWLRCSFVEIASPHHADWRYRIPAQPEPVWLFIKGKAITRLCVQPLDPVPDADVVIMHKLMIEADEEGYLDLANRLPPLELGEIVECLRRALTGEDPAAADDLFE
jgi:hypothetical protein